MADIPVTIQLRADGKGLVGTMRVNSREARKMGDSFDDVGRRARGAGDQVERFGAKSSRAGRLFKTFARGVVLAAGITSVGVAFSGSANAAINFEERIAEVSTLLDDTSSLDGMTEATRRLSVEYGRAPTDQAQALYQIISAGASDSAQALAILDQSNKLAIGGVTGLENAADGLTNILNAYGEAAGGANNVSDALFVAMRQGKTTIGQLSSSIGQVAPIASTAGVGLQELLAAISAITTGGVSTSRAVTGLQGVLNAVLRPTEQAREMAKDLGLEFSTSAIRAQGFASWLEQVQEKTGGSDEILGQLFGRVEGLNSVLQLVGGQAEKFSENLQAMEDRAGATDAALEKMLDTARSKTNRAKQAILGLAIDGGNQLLLVLAPAAAFVADNIEAIGSAMKTGLTIATVYFAVFHAAPAGLALVKAAVRAIKNEIIGVRLAQEAGIKAALTWKTAMAGAARVVFAAFVGWQIGTWIRENFVEARVAALAFVGAVLKGWEELRGIATFWFEMVQERIQQVLNVWNSAMSAILSKAAETFDRIGSAMEKIPGMSEQAAGVRAFAGALREAADSSEAAINPTRTMGEVWAENREKVNANKAAVDEIIVDLIAYELQQDQANKSTQGGADALAEYEARMREALAGMDGMPGAAGGAGDAVEDFTQSLQKEIVQLRRGQADLKDRERGLIDFEVASLRAAGASQAQIDALQPLIGVYLREQAALETLREEQERSEELRKGAESFDALRDSLEQEIKALEGGEVAWEAYQRAMFVAGEVAQLQGEVTDKHLSEIEALADRLFSLRDANMDVAGSFENVAGAAAQALRSMQGLAKNGSKEYKVIEIAINAINAALAIKAILNQGGGDPYSAPVRMAMMAAAVAPLVGSIASFNAGGGAGAAANRQATQGTGSVLGDETAKSESIVRATDITAEATSALVGINRGMLRALIGLQSGIEGAVRLMARGGQPDFGVQTGSHGSFDPLGDTLFGSLPGFDSLAGAVGNFLEKNWLARDPLARAIFKFLGGKTKIKDEGIQILSGSIGDLLEGVLIGAYADVSVKKNILSGSKTKELFEPFGDEMSTQVGLIVQSIVDTVTAAAEALGFLPADIQARLDTFVIEAQKISLKDLSPEEQQAELEAVFGKLFDDLSAHVVPFIGEFQEVGEGAGETLIRVATSVQVMEEAVKRFGWAVDQVDIETFARMSVELIEAAGGIEEFINKMGSFIEKFATDEAKFAIAQDELIRAFDGVGLALPPTREAMWDLMKTLDPLTEEGREHIAMLLELGPVADAYYKHLESAEKDRLRFAQDIEDQIAAFTLSPLRQEWRLTERAQAEQIARASEVEDSTRQLTRVYRLHELQTLDMITRLSASLNNLRDRWQALTGSGGGDTQDFVQPVISGEQDLHDTRLQHIEQLQRAVEGAGEWIRRNLTGPASPLPRRQQLGIAREQFFGTFGEFQAAREAGDTETMARLAETLPQLADTLLAKGGESFGTATPLYAELFQAVMDAMGDVADTVVPETPDTPGTGNGPVAASQIGGLQQTADDIAAKELEMVQVAGQILEELGVMKQLTGEPLAELVEKWDIPMREMVETITGELHDNQIETVDKLVAVAATVNTSVTNLADVIGVEIGALTDATSVVSQVFDDTLSGIPEEFRDQLQPHLDALRNATTDADANAALEALQEVTGGLPEEYKNLLAPFFEGIDVTSEAQEQVAVLGRIETINANQLSAIEGVDVLLDKIRQGLNAANGAEGLPQFASGIHRVPHDMTAGIHKDETIIDPTSARILRQYGIHVKSTGGGDSRLLTEIKSVLQRIEGEIQGGNLDRADIGELNLKRLEKLAGTMDDNSRRGRSREAVGLS